MQAPHHDADDMVEEPNFISASCAIHDGLGVSKSGGSDLGGEPQICRDETTGPCRRIQFVVMTDAGKPVYSYCRRCEDDPTHQDGQLRNQGELNRDSAAAQNDENDEDVSKMCSLLRAMCGSVEYYSDLNLDSSSGEADDGGETIRCLQSGNQLIVFLSVGAVTLVALSTGRNPQEHHLMCPTAAFLRLQLEYLYGYILCTLTDQIQVRLTLDPSYDLRMDLGVSTEIALHSLIDEMSTRRPAPFLTCSVPVFFPLDAQVRDVASRTLKAVGDVTPNTLLALLLFGSELISVVQPSYVAVRGSDLLLLRHVVARQERSALDRRLWIPVCLPRLHSSGYLHAYIHSLGVVSRMPAESEKSPLLLVFVGSVGSTEQFNLFRRAEASVRAQLGLRSDEATTSGTPAPSALSGIIDGRERHADGGDGGVASPWRQADDRRGSDEDYVDASGDGDRMIKFVHDNDANSLPGDSAPGLHDDEPPWSLLHHIQSSHREALVEEYLGATGALHFMLSLNVSIREATNGRGRRTSAVSKEAIPLRQSITSAFRDPIATDWDKQRIWTAYQRLSLKLRIGSSTIEATNDAMDAITCDEREGGGENANWSMMRLLEKHPAIEGICYTTEGIYTFLALNGADFEFYLTFPRSVPIRQAATSGGRLARRIILDKETLFVANPLLWNDDGA